MLIWWETVPISLFTSTLLKYVSPRFHPAHRSLMVLMLVPVLMKPSLGARSRSMLSLWRYVLMLVFMSRSRFTLRLLLCSHWLCLRPSTSGKRLTRTTIAPKKSDKWEWVYRKNRSCPLSKVCPHFSLRVYMQSFLFVFSTMLVLNDITKQRPHRRWPTARPRRHECPLVGLGMNIHREFILAIEVELEVIQELLFVMHTFLQIERTETAHTWWIDLRWRRASHSLRCCGTKRDPEPGGRE